MKIAAIQMEARLADVAANMRCAKKWIGKAAEGGAELVLLPEFFTSAIGFSEDMFEAVRNNRDVEGRMKQWALEYGIIVGGSYIVYDGTGAYNRFLLCFPDGNTFRHDKDIPTQFENCYYTRGDENHVLETPIGNIGVALCWEMIRCDTVRRMAGKVDLVLAGSCWWDLPEDAPPERQPLRDHNQNLAEGAPVRLAGLLRVPVVHAAHCGKISTRRFPAGDAVQTRRLVGATQIIGPDGGVIEKRPFREGAGIVTAELEWDTRKRRRREAPAGYWIPDLPPSYLQAWDTLNPLGERYYRDVALPAYRALWEK